MVVAGIGIVLMCGARHRMMNEACMRIEDQPAQENEQADNSDCL
ncbi:MAG: hypothetical protein ACI8PT_003961 [Gammaproteobacteria bacterium]|jgi:hypothetical protein